MSLVLDPMGTPTLFIVNWTLHYQLLIYINYTSFPSESHDACYASHDISGHIYTLFVGCFLYGSLWILLCCLYNKQTHAYIQCTYVHIHIHTHMDGHTWMRGYGKVSFCVCILYIGQLYNKHMHNKGTFLRSCFNFIRVLTSSFW